MARILKWKPIEEADVPAEVQFHLPPANQGQIVDVSYGAWGGMVYRRRHDKSDGLKQYSMRSWRTSDGDCDFWNHAPEAA